MATKRILLIDGDINIYQQAAIAENPVKWDDDIWTLHAFESDGQQGIDSELQWIMEETNADEMIIALSDDKNFRYDVLPTYKHNRSSTRPPMLRKVLKQYVIDNYNTFMRPGLEGDDVLGILMTSKQVIKGDVEKIIVSIDKDMQTVPGKHLRLNDAKRMMDEGAISCIDEAIFEVTPKQAARYHYMQTLMGDATDGYAGCPGVGKVTANKILDAVEENCTLWADDNAWHVAMWEAIVKQYEKKKLSEEAALQQARVARICHNTDYNFKKKEVILWNPPK